MSGIDSELNLLLIITTYLQQMGPWTGSLPMLPSWPQKKNKSPLSSSRNATLHVGDINRPVFHQASWGSKWPRVALTEPPLPRSAPQILTWTQEQYLLLPCGQFGYFKWLWAGAECWVGTVTCSQVDLNNVSVAFTQLIVYKHLKNYRITFAYKIPYYISLSVAWKITV